MLWLKIVTVQYQVHFPTPAKSLHDKSLDWQIPCAIKSPKTTDAYSHVMCNSKPGQIWTISIKKKKSPLTDFDV